MAAGGHFGFWLLTNSAAIFARVMGAKFFRNTSKSSNQVSNLTMLSVVTGPPDCTQLFGQIFQGFRKNFDCGQNFRKIKNLVKFSKNFDFFENFEKISFQSIFYKKFDFSQITEKFRF